MLANGLGEPAATASKPWWREGEALGLIVLVVVAYFLRAGELPIRGEEPTRAQMAREMVIWGDFIVPREQGAVYGIRPPLQNWLIAASCQLFGSWDAWPVRFHSLLATLATTLLTYAYSRTFLSRLGALSAGLAIATFADMFQMGRQAETEALFTFFVSASLLVWHGGLSRGWPDGLTFALGYGLMALGMLTKGMQAPAYFIGSLTAYLVLTRQWRRLFSAAHVLGALTAAAVLAAWMIPYALATNWSAAFGLWLGDPSYRVNGSILTWDIRQVLAHLAIFPLEVFAGTLPWSPLLLLLLRRDVHEGNPARRPHVLFLGLCLGIAFLTCWVPPGGLPRYFAPLFPCVAVMVGLVIERIAEFPASAEVAVAGRRYFSFLAGLMACAALAVMLLALFFAEHRVLGPFAERPPVAAAYSLGFLTLAALIAASQRRGAWHKAAVGSTALCMTMLFTGLFMDVRLRRSEFAAESMKRLKEALPPGQPLTCLGGPVDALFAYYYGPPIIVSEPWPSPAPDAGADAGKHLSYFCIPSSGSTRPTLPFDWVEIGAISMERNKRPVPGRVVVVGRRTEANGSLRHSGESSN